MQKQVDIKSAVIQKRQKEHPLEKWKPECKHIFWKDEDPSTDHEKVLLNKTEVGGYSNELTEKDFG